jgi:hypothetical protein
MEKMLHLLETFNARGSDGTAYVVHGYEHLARLDEAPGAMRLADSDVRLERSPRNTPARVGSP